MAKSSKNARRPDACQIAAQRNPGGSGKTQAQRNAERRQQRRKSSRNSTIAWVSVGAVLVVLAALLVLNATKSTTTSTTGDAAGRNPVLAPASVTGPLATVPAAVFDSVGVAGMPATLTVTAKQTKLTSAGLPRFVYDGAEFCPFCAMDRWAMVTVLYRFGTFTGLKQIASSSTDSPASIPTLSFLRSKYTSKYLDFTPYEDADIARNPLVNPPADVLKLYATYDAPINGNGTAFDGGQGGIPFIDIANQYISAGTPAAYTPIENALQGNGLTHTQIAQAIADPTSSIGTTMGSKFFIGEANYLSAGISAVDGGQPATVCRSKGVAAATAVLKVSTKVSG